LVLCALLSKPISARIATDAARELARTAGRTPAGMNSVSWQQRVDALGRAHYKRYDESTATRLGDLADVVVDRYRGDLRRLVDAADRQVPRARDLLQEFPGIGPTGADIFLREVQAVWPWVRPFSDQRVARAASELRLPHSTRGLARLAGSDDLSHLTAVLMRVSSDRTLREAVLASA